MNWMQFTAFYNKTPILINLSLAFVICAHKAGGSSIYTDHTDSWHVTESPDEIANRSDWTQR